MTWARDTIKLGAAQKIFSQFNIQAETLGDADTVVGYSAQISKNGTMTDVGLTSLCCRIVEHLVDCANHPE